MTRIRIMTDDFQEIDGIGPAREERLNDAGYETYDDLGEADYEELAEEIERLPEDSALEIVVQAQNLSDLENAEVEGYEAEEAVEELPDEEEFEEEVEEAQDDDEPEPPEEAEPEVEGEVHYSVEMNFDGAHEYDTFYHTLIEERCALRRTNRSGVESYDKMLASMRDTSVTGGFTVELTKDEMNDLHNAVLEQRLDYQGENLIDYMDALNRVENNLNEIREEYLF